MERILRSVIQIGGYPDTEDTTQNWNKLAEHDIEFNDEDKNIYEYVKLFYSQLAAPPDFTLVREFFEKKDDVDTVTRLDEIKKAQVHIRTNFLSIIRNQREQQQIRGLAILCRDATAIAEHGRNIDKPVNGKKILRGHMDAIAYLSDGMSKLSTFETGEKLEGVVTDDADELIEEYDTIEKTNQYSGRNLFGLEPVDSVCQGHKIGEFWVHAAFPGELKTTLALNYAYNNAYIYGKSIFYAILEMPYKQLRRQLYVLHSSHGKFVTDWYEEDRKNGVADKDRYVGLDYRGVRDGVLTPLAKKRLQIVAQDFKATCKGKLFVWKPSEEVSIPEIRRKAEIMYNKHGCDGIVIDHLLKVKPSQRSNDAVDRINTIVSEARNLALNFVRGKGAPVLALFQMNRQGKMRADKADGYYDVQSIAYANRVLEDADVVTYTYLNAQLRQDGKFYLGNLKNRDNPMFERMTGKIIWQSKRMRALSSSLFDIDDTAIKNANTFSHQLSYDDMILDKVG